MKIHLGDIADWTILGVGLEKYQDRVLQLAGAENRFNENLIEPVNDYTFGNTATSLAGTISADSELTVNWPAYWPFNSEIAPNPAVGFNNFGWIGTLNHIGWLRNTLTTGIVINKITIQSINSGNYVRSPIDFTIRGSNDNFVADDNILLTVVNEPTWNQGQTRIYMFDNYTRYTSYEINITKVQTNNAPGIGKVEFMTLASTFSPQAEAPIILFDGTLDPVLPVVIDDQRTGTGSLLFQYNIDETGYNSVWITEAAMNTALAGLTITSIQFKAQFNAALVDRVRLHNSPTYTEATQIINRFVLPVEVIETEVLEVIEL